jgi:NAD(P)-dependent dehydrogenase (short-subunit alcohol dehydrogenase family)
VLTDMVNVFGRLDVLINLVGGFTSGHLIKTDVGMWQKMLTLNVPSAFLLSRAAIPRMPAQRSGRIIHITARTAVAHSPGAAAYVESKAALVSLIRVLALELTGTGVTMNGTCRPRLTPQRIDKACRRLIRRSGPGQSPSRRPCSFSHPTKPTKSMEPWFWSGKRMTLPSEGEGYDGQPVQDR